MNRSDVTFQTALARDYARQIVGLAVERVGLPDSAVHSDRLWIDAAPGWIVLVRGTANGILVQLVDGSGRICQTIALQTVALVVAVECVAALITFAQTIAPAPERITP